MIEIVIVLLLVAAWLVLFCLWLTNEQLSSRQKKQKLEREREIEKLELELDLHETGASGIRQPPPPKPGKIIR